MRIERHDIHRARGLYGSPGLGVRVLSTAEVYARKYGIDYPPALAGLGLLGDIAPQQINQIATIGAQTTVGLLVTLGTIGGPIGAAIGGLVAVASVVANMFHGCGQTCIVASQDANKVESQILKPNLDQYLNAPVHYASMQAAALNNVDTAFKALYQACSDPQLGSAGQRCISERLVQGGTAPWCPKPGHTGCDWYALYRDPIANDANVQPDPIGNLTGAPGADGSTLAEFQTTNLVPALVAVVALGAIIWAVSS